MANEPGGPAIEPRPAEPAPNRTGRREPLVIDAEAKDVTAPPAAAPSAADAPKEREQNAAQHKAPPEAKLSEPRPEPVAVQPPRRSRLIAGGLVGCLAGVVIAGGLFWYFAAQQNDDIAELGGGIGNLSERVAKLEARPLPAPPLAPADDTAALAGLDRRLSAAETALRGLGETTNAARSDAQKALAAAEARPASSAPIGATPPAPAPAAPPVDLGPLTARVDHIEAELAPLDSGLAATRTDLGALATRTSAGLASSDAAARAVIAGSLIAALDRGTPYAAELTALGATGIDPASTTALQAFAPQGAPTVRSLSTRFAALAPSLLAVPADSAPQGLLDRLSQSARGLVDVHSAAAPSGNEPSAVVARITAALDHDDLAGALAAWAALPPPAQAASQDWAQAAKARLAADAAARAILTEAIGKLGHPKS